LSEREENKMTNFIVKVKDLESEVEGHKATLYKCHPSIQYMKDWDTETVTSTEYIVISAIPSAFDTGESEVMVFPSNSSGMVTRWIEIIGRRGTMDHNEMIQDLAYVLVDKLF